MTKASAGSSASTKRTHPFSLRLSDAERAFLARAAGRSRSMASYARERLFGEMARPSGVRVARAPTVDRALLAQALGKLGRSNLSRDFTAIASAASSGALEATPELERSLLASCADLQAMRDDLTKALGLKVRE